MVSTLSSLSPLSPKVSGMTRKFSVNEICREIVLRSLREKRKTKFIFCDEHLKNIKDPDSMSFNNNNDDDDASIDRASSDSASSGNKDAGEESRLAKVWMQQLSSHDKVNDPHSKSGDALYALETIFDKEEEGQENIDVGHGSVHSDDDLMQPADFFAFALGCPPPEAGASKGKSTKETTADTALTHSSRLFGYLLLTMPPSHETSFDVVEKDNMFTCKFCSVNLVSCSFEGISKALLELLVTFHITCFKAISPELKPFVLPLMEKFREPSNDPRNSFLNTRSFTFSLPDYYYTLASHHINFSRLNMSFPNLFLKYVSNSKVNSSFRSNSTLKLSNISSGEKSTFSIDDCRPKFVVNPALLLLFENRKSRNQLSFESTPSSHRHHKANVVRLECSDASLYCGRSMGPSSSQPKSSPLKDTAACCHHENNTIHRGATKILKNEDTFSTKSIMNNHDKGCEICNGDGRKFKRSFFDIDPKLRNVQEQGEEEKQEGSKSGEPSTERGKRHFNPQFSPQRSNITRDLPSCVEDQCEDSKVLPSGYTNEALSMHCSNNIYNGKLPSHVGSPGIVNPYYLGNYSSGQLPHIFDPHGGHPYPSCLQFQNNHTFPPAQQDAPMFAYRPYYQFPLACQPTMTIPQSNLANSSIDPPLSVPHCHILLSKKLPVTLKENKKYVTLIAEYCQLSELDPPMYEISSHAPPFSGKCTWLGKIFYTSLQQEQSSDRTDFLHKRPRENWSSSSSYSIIHMKKADAKEELARIALAYLIITKKIGQRLLENIKASSLIPFLAPHGEREKTKPGENLCSSGKDESADRMMPPGQYFGYPSPFFYPPHSAMCPPPSQTSLFHGHHRQYGGSDRQRHSSSSDRPTRDSPKDTIRYMDSHRKINDNAENT